MEVVKSVHDFKAFMQANREKMYGKAIKASEISIHDEWMKEDQWDRIYKQEGKEKNRKL